MVLVAYSVIVLCIIIKVLSVALQSGPLWSIHVLLCCCASVNVPHGSELACAWCRRESYSGEDSLDAALGIPVW